MSRGLKCTGYKNFSKIFKTVNECLPCLLYWYCKAKPAERSDRSMDRLTEAKSARLLEIYSRLVNGEFLGKAALAEQYHVSDRSIQRDMESLRCFITNQSLAQDILAPLLRPFWTGCPLLRSSNRTKPAGLSRQRSLAKELICGSAVRATTLLF